MYVAQLATQNGQNQTGSDRATTLSIKDLHSILGKFRGHFTFFSLDDLEALGEYYTQLIVLQWSRIFMGQKVDRFESFPPTVK